MNTGRWWSTGTCSRSCPTTTRTPTGCSKAPRLRRRHRSHGKLRHYRSFCGVLIESCSRLTARLSENNNGKAGGDGPVCEGCFLDLCTLSTNLFVCPAFALDDIRDSEMGVFPT